MAVTEWTYSLTQIRMRDCREIHVVVASDHDGTMVEAGPLQEFRASAIDNERPNWNPYHQALGIYH